MNCGRGCCALGCGGQAQHEAKARQVLEDEVKALRVQLDRATRGKKGRPTHTLDFLQSYLPRVSARDRDLLSTVLEYVAELEADAELQKQVHEELDVRFTRAWEALCDVVGLCDGLVPEHAMQAPRYVEKLKQQLADLQAKEST